MDDMNLKLDVQKQKYGYFIPINFAINCLKSLY